MKLEIKPILIFDGDCVFCRYWASRWKHMTGNRIDYAASQEAGSRFPQIPPERFDESIQLVDTDGSVYDGAEAVFRALACAPGRAWPLALYRKYPPITSMAEWTYGIVARNRRAFGWLSQLACGKEFEPSSYFLIRKIFLILLGAVYCVAFLSLWSQMEGLIGSGGILPASETFESLRDGLGTERFWRFPNIFWLADGDAFMHAACLAGVLLSVCLMIGIFRAPALFLLWLIYLSFVNAGQVFMAFQWDTLLLETGFLAIFLAPVKGRLDAESAASPVMIFLYRLLLFKVLFSSGMVKLLSGDPSWQNLTALQFHYETQPLPTWIGWYAHQLSPALQKFSVLCVFIIQIAVPFLIFAPRRLRILASGVMVSLQILIALTGNYCFFNVLTIGLCLFLLDDASLRKFLPGRFFEERLLRGGQREPLLKRILVGAAAALVIFISATFQLIPLLTGGLEFSPSMMKLYQGISPFRSINPYGLFAVMTTTRPEIIVEGSDDMKEWKAYGFKWKPGDLKRRPGFAAPHQPRLDWQMWFAALSHYEQNPWFIRFIVRLLQGSEEVLALLAHNPFPDDPPHYIRAVVYEYRFTNFAERGVTGAWWKREFKGMYAPILSLPEAK